MEINLRESSSLLLDSSPDDCVYFERWGFRAAVRDKGAICRRLAATIALGLWATRWPAWTGRCCVGEAVSSSSSLEELLSLK